MRPSCHHTGVHWIWNWDAKYSCMLWLRIPMRSELLNKNLVWLRWMRS